MSDWRTRKGYQLSVLTAYTGRFISATKAFHQLVWCFTKDLTDNCSLFTVKNFYSSINARRRQTSQWQSLHSPLPSEGSHEKNVDEA
ncbi:MAG TPA: hypothetical protein V6D25_19295 [Leptolyngbyaceae cyanobacterium]